MAKSIWPCDDQTQTLLDAARKGDDEAIRRMNLGADVLFGVAAAGVITGVVLFFVEPGLGEEKPVAVAPAVAHDGFGLTIEGRF